MSETPSCRACAHDRASRTPGNPDLERAAREDGRTTPSLPFGFGCPSASRKSGKHGERKGIAHANERIGETRTIGRRKPSGIFRKALSQHELSRFPKYSDLARPQGAGSLVARGRMRFAQGVHPSCRKTPHAEAALLRSDRRAPKKRCRPRAATRPCHPARTLPAMLAKRPRCTLLHTTPMLSNQPKPPQPTLRRAPVRAATNATNQKQTQPMGLEPVERSTGPALRATRWLHLETRFEQPSSRIPRKASSTPCVTECGAHSAREQSLKRLHLRSAPPQAAKRAEENRSGLV